MPMSNVRRSLNHSYSVSVRRQFQLFNSRPLLLFGPARRHPWPCNILIYSVCITVVGVVMVDWWSLYCVCVDFAEYYSFSVWYISVHWLGLFTLHLLLFVALFSLSFSPSSSCSLCSAAVPMASWGCWWQVKWPLLPKSAFFPKRKWLLQVICDDDDDIRITVHTF